jgi:hypothetical protein
VSCTLDAFLDVLGIADMIFLEGIVTGMRRNVVKLQLFTLTQSLFVQPKNCRARKFWQQFLMFAVQVCAFQQ